MYLDTDVILALIKDGGWLESKFERERLSDAKTSVITIIEVQLVYFDSRPRHFLSSVMDLIKDQNIEILDLEDEIVEKSSLLIEKYEKLNVFDSLHLAHAEALEEPIISTDTLYPEIDEVENIDPREL